MRCPNCGYPKAQYDVSRKGLWGKHKGKKVWGASESAERTNFKAHCTKCGHKWDDAPVGIVSVEAPVEQPEEEENLDEEL